MDIWISTKEAAMLLCYDESTVRKKAKNNEYKVRKVSSTGGRGGKKMEILLNSLPEYAQNAYHNQRGQDLPVVNPEQTYTKAQRDRGELRRLAISQYKEFKKAAKKAGSKKETIIKNDFVEKWNFEHPENTITVKTLYEWLKKGKKHNLNVLNDHRGGYNRGTSTIDPKYQRYFKDLYLRETQPTISFCYKQTKALADQNGDVIPGEKAFRLLVQNIHPGTLTKYREGNKDFEDTMIPTILRNPELYELNEMWVSDHHRIDLFIRVQDEKGNWKPVRPWLTTWMDMRTRKIVSQFVRVEDPDSDIVLLTFANAIENFGIPQIAYLDNGKDYKAMDLFASKKAAEQFKQNVSSNLKIEVTFANPYNAKAKPVERFHSTYESQFGKMFPTYAGRDAKNRPENLKNVDIMEYPTLEEFTELNKKYIREYYNEVTHHGEGMHNKSPNELYAELLPNTIIRKAQRDEIFYCMTRIKPGTRKIGKNGITFNKEEFYSPEAPKYIGTKVFVRYSPLEPNKLLVFDTNDNFLFLAVKRKRLGLHPSPEEYKEAAEMKKAARQAMLNDYKPDATFQTLGAVQEQLQILTANTPKAPLSKPNKVELVKTPMRDLSRQMSQSELDRNYERMFKQREEQTKKMTDKQKEDYEQFRKNVHEQAEAM